MMVICWTSVFAFAFNKNIYEITPDDENIIGSHFEIDIFFRAKNRTERIALLYSWEHSAVVKLLYGDFIYELNFLIQKCE